MNLLLGLASATERPFSKRAPVGHTWTHLPQLVHELAHITALGRTLYYLHALGYVVAVP